MSFEFLVKLEDQMSGPAAEAQSALDKLTASIRRLQAQQLRSSANELKGSRLATIKNLRADKLEQMNERDVAASARKRSALERALDAEQMKFSLKDETSKDDLAARRKESRQQRYWRWQDSERKKAAKEIEQQNEFAITDETLKADAAARKKESRQQRFWRRQAQDEKSQNDFRITDETEKEERALRKLAHLQIQAKNEDHRRSLNMTEKRLEKDQAVIRKLGVMRSNADDENQRRTRRLGLLQMDAQKENKQRSSLLYKLSPRTYNALNKEGSILGPAIVASVVYEAGKLAVKAVEGIYHAAEAVWDRMIPAIDVREQGKIGFKYAFGEEGQEWASQRFDEMSRQMGRPAGELFDQAKMFGNLGASKEETNNMLLAISDTKAVGRDSGKLETAFESMLSRPTLSTRSFQGQLTGVINESKLWTQLAKDLSIATKKPVSVAQAGWLVQHNYVSGKIGRQALLETIQEQEGGRLGNASLERAQKTWDGMTGRMNATIDSLLGKLSEGKGWQTFTDAFNNLVTALENSDVRESIGDIADSLGSLFKPLTGDSGLEKIEAFFRRLNVAVQKSLDVILLFNAAYEVLPFVPHPGRVLGPIIDNLLDPGLPEKERNTRPVVHLPTMDLSRPHVMNVTSHVHIHGGVNDPKVLEHHVKKATKEAVQDVIDKLNTEDGGDQE